MNAEHIVFLTEWAARWGAHLQIAGTVGFGRECVGIAHDGSYIDYSGLTSQAEFWTPEDAYHKHDCLAVLGRGDDAITQLHDWVKWLDEHGYTVETVARNPSSGLEAIIHGLSVSRLVPPAPAAEQEAPAGVAS